MLLKRKVEQLYEDISQKIKSNQVIRLQTEKEFQQNKA